MRRRFSVALVVWLAVCFALGFVADAFPSMSKCKAYDATSSQMGGTSQEAPAATLTYDAATTSVTFSSTGDTSSTLSQQGGILAWISGTGAAIKSAAADGASDNGQAPCDTSWRIGSTGSSLGVTSVSYAVTPPTSGSATFGVAWAPSKMRLKFRTVAVPAKSVSFTGPIIDVFCWDRTSGGVPHSGLDGAILDTNPQDHTVHCLRDIADCRANGYAILEKPAGAAKWSIKYKLDATGNTNALKIIDSTKTIQDLRVTVTGVVNADGVTMAAAAVVESNAVTCDTFACPLATHRQIGAASTTNCDASGCTQAKCCEPLPKCDSYTCPAATHKRIGAASTTNCDASGCTQAKCCELLPKCDTYTCTTAGNVRIAAAATTTCAASGCSDSTCCTKPNMCSTFTCAAAGTELIAAASTTSCDAAGCSAGTCCEASPKCNSYNGCPAATHKRIAAAAATTCDPRPAGCTTKKCCELLAKCSSYACPAATHVAISSASTTACDAGGCITARCCEAKPKAAKVSFTGPIVDIFCWDRTSGGVKHAALDGAVLDTNPQDHTVHCLRDIADCRANGYAILQKPAGAAKWSIKYKLDATGNTNALKIIDSTKTIQDLRVTVTGTLNGDGVTLEGATMKEAEPAAFPLDLADGLTLDRTLLQKEGDKAAAGDEIESLEFTIKVNRNAWVGVGISAPGATGAAAMTGGGDGSDIVACSGGTVKRYWVTSLSVPTGGAEVPGSTCTQQAGSTTMTFTRAVAAASATERALSLGSADTVIWAMGADGVTTMTNSGHKMEDRGVIKVDLEGGGATTVTKSGSAALWLHLVLMCLSWGALLPWGAAVASRAKGVDVGAHKTAWFKIHLRFQVLGWFLQLAGFGMAVWLVQSHGGGAHFAGGSVPHKIIGLVVVVLGTLQPLNAQLRPHPPEGGWASLEGGKPMRRVLWEVAHKGSGHVAVVLGIVNVALGVVAAKNLGYAMVVVAVGAALLGLGAGSCLIFILASFCNKSNVYAGCCLRCFGGGASPSAIQGKEMEISEINASP
eukprot:g1249.t1